MMCNRKNARREADCGYATTNLSRYLDNDLASADATVVAAHLHGCLSCRNAFDTMRAQQSIVSALPVPPGGWAARDRVLRRLEAGVPVRRTALANPLSLPRSRGRLAATSFAVCGIAAAAAALIISKRFAPIVKPSAPVAVVQPVVPRQLPASDEMTMLFALHDKQVSACARALAPAPSAAHKIAERRAAKKPASRVAAESQQERVARLATKAVGDNLALGPGNHGALSAEYVASDEVPEAL